MCQKVPPNLAYMSNIWHAYSRDECTYICNIWSHWHQPFDKKYCTHIWHISLKCSSYIANIAYTVNRIHGKIYILTHTHIYMCVCDSSGNAGWIWWAHQVTIYPICTTSFQRTVILATPILGSIDTGWQATQLTYKQPKHTKSRCSG